MLKDKAKKAWRGVSVAAAVAAGFILLPLTLPFLSVVDHLRQSEGNNRELWKKYADQHKKSKWYYFKSISHIAALSVFNFFKTLWVFIKAFGLAFRDAVSIGSKKGLLGIMRAPSESTNEYTLDQEKIQGKLYFRPQHLLKLSLILGVLIAIGVTVAALIAPGGFSVLGLLGIHQFTGGLYFFLTFLMSTALGAAMAAAFQIVLHTFIRLNFSTASILNPEGKTAKDKVKNVFAKIGYFFEEIFAVVLGIPIYLIFKPMFHLFHSMRAWWRSSKSVWHNGAKYAETTKSSFREYALKFLLWFALLGNTILRIVMLPFQLLMTALYSPYQAVRHGTRYGLSHVLKYPINYVNKYRAGLFLKNGEKYQGNAKKNYKNITLAEYKNVYYFRFKHLFMLSLLVALVFTILTYVVPPLGSLSIGLSIKILTPLGGGGFVASGVFNGIINFLFGFIGTYVVAAGLYVLSRLSKLLGWSVNTMHRLIKKQTTLNHLFHKKVEAGDAFRIMVNENLLVKTIASTVKRDKAGEDGTEEEKRIDQFGMSWDFNIKQFNNPSGFYLFERNRPVPLKEGETARPIYFPDDKKRKYARNKTYKRWNPQTGEWEIRKMGGERGRARPGMWLRHYLTFGLFPMVTKKTCVSLAPKDGMMAYFGGRDDAIGIALDLSKLGSDNKYVFTRDVFSNLKWHWSWMFKRFGHHARRSVTTQELRNQNKSYRTRGLFPHHNEIIKRIHKDALCAIIVSTRRRQDRINGLLRKLIIKYELGVDLPILLAGKLSNDPKEAMVPEEYTVEQQLVDLYVAANNPKDDPQSAKIYSKVSQYYSDAKSKGYHGKKSFCRTLINSHRVNWATVFKHIDEESHVTRSEFQQYVESAADIKLPKTTSQVFLPTHYVPRVI